MTLHSLLLRASLKVAWEEFSSHPFVERLIGTLRCENLDRILFWTTADLEAKLTN
jgi:hypothetical protein